MSNNTWYKVCSNGWTTNYSDSLCQAIGYSKSASSHFVKLNNTESVLRLKEELALNADDSFLQKLEKTDVSCDSVVAVTCQEYCKFC